MSILIIAEKPSVARGICPVVKADSKKKGYIEGNGYIVSWCLGHLVGLKYPNDYGNSWESKWSFSQLPMIPREWLFKVTDSTKEQFHILKDLMNRGDVTEIICATDADREGETIFRYVYNMVGCHKPVKRLWVSSLEEYIPPQKNIIGNAEYRYISDKQYISADRDTVLKMAEIMLSRNVQFSGRIYPNGKATLTISGADLAHVQAIQQNVIAMRKQFAKSEKADEIIGNKAYRDIRQRQFFYSKLTHEQYKEVQPYLDTDAQYSGLIRDNKVIFTVEKDDSANFHRALENAQRELGIINTLKNNGIDNYRLEKLSAVIHRFAVEDIHESLDSFFTPQLDEKHFDKMLSLPLRQTQSLKRSIISI